MGSESEHDLWARSLKGDGEAFGVLFDQHHPVVFRRALYLVGERSAAEDVVATAFLELWRRRDAVRVVDGSVLAWLLVTTTNVSRNVRRGTRRYRALLERLPRLEPGPDAAEVFLSDGRPQDDELAAALRSLRERDLQIITLVVLEGFGLAHRWTRCSPPRCGRNSSKRSGPPSGAAGAGGSVVRWPGSSWSVPEPGPLRPARAQPPGWTR